MTGVSFSAVFLHRLGTALKTGPFRSILQTSLKVLIITLVMQGRPLFLCRSRVLADAPEAKSRHRPQILVCLHRIHPEKSHGRPDTVTGASLSLRGRTMLRTHERDPAAASQTLQESFMFLGRTVISNPGLHSSCRCHPRTREGRASACVTGRSLT